MTKVAYPKLTLYAFHLRHNLAQGEINPVSNANGLWLKCQELGQKLGIPKLEALPSLIPAADSQVTGNLLPANTTFTAIEHNTNLHLRGEVTPLLIHDTYALDLTLRYPQPEVGIANLKGLNPDNCLLPSYINASLGQTLVLFVQPVGKVTKEADFALNCVEALLTPKTYQELQLTCQAKGNLLGGSLFEFNNDATSPQQQCHLLVWLNSSEQTNKLEESGEYYYPLIDLLLCRSKIIYANSQATWCYQQARQDYQRLEANVNEFNQLKERSVKDIYPQLQQQLRDLPEIAFSYGRSLRDLEIQKTTIKTNSKNYKLNLDKLNKLCLKEDNLELFHNFLNLAETTSIEQIETNLAYLAPAQTLFNQMIETIRGSVEIEQAKRERSLEITIQVFGVGLATAGIVSAAVGEYKDTPIVIAPQKPTHPAVNNLLLSLVAGVIAASITRLFVGLRYKNK